MLVINYLPVVDELQPLGVHEPELEGLDRQQPDDLDREDQEPENRKDSEKVRDFSVRP